MSFHANVYAAICQRIKRVEHRGALHRALPLLVLCALFAAALPSAIAQAHPRVGSAGAAVAAPAIQAVTQAAATATILVPSLRVRTGPATGFPIIDSALAGESYPVLTQAGNCAWLQIEQSDGDVLWISGASVYVRLSTPCAAVPAFRAEDEPPRTEEFVSSGAESVTILVPSLRVRSGPGVGFPIIDAALFNESYPVLAQSGGCRWLQVRQLDGDLVWISGARIYVRYANGCDAIPPADAAAAIEVGSNESTEAEPVPVTNASVQLDQANIFAPTLGCYFFQNQSFVQATVTLTLQTVSEGVDFQVAAGEEVLYCLEPGRYTFTLDAPPPYGSLNGDFEAIEGERAIFPIRTID